jgi:rhamnogalacturonyl hydrolase YesR
MNRNVFLFLFLFLTAPLLPAQTGVPENFPEGYAPEEVGKRLAYHFTDDRHELYAGRWIHYAEVCTWYGAVRFAAATKDGQLLKRLQDRFEPLFTREKKLMPPMNHVDLNMIGSLILELYRMTGDTRYRDLGIAYADSQWEVPAGAKPEEKAWADRGYSWQTRLWIDDMYMITILQSQAYKVTGDRKYLDRAAGEMVLYLDGIQRPNGLFYHAPDVPFYWGRGDGWMAAGMAELLGCLPEGHKDRPRILKGFHAMMESLKKYQRPDGMWNQLIDEPDCWAETSATAMFTYAFITGIKNGWLDAEAYAPAARKAWLAMIPYIDERNNVTEVCIGTGKRNDKQYYYDRTRLAGDFHGQAPYLWCAAALLER